MSTLTAVEQDSARLKASDVVLALAIVLPLAAVIAPYRPVHVPQTFILAVALLFGAYCLRLALQDAEALIFIFLLYIPFQKVLPGDFGGTARAVNFTNALLLLLFLGWLVRPRDVPGAWCTRGWTLFDAAVVLFLAILTLSMVAQALRETEEMRYETLSDLKRWLTPIIVYFLILGIGVTPRTARKLLLAVVVTTAVIGLLGVKEFWMDMGGGSRHSLEEIRIEVTSGPSNLGAFFAYYLPYIAALWLGNIWRLSYWAFVAPLVWCMDALRVTFSRGAVLAFLAAVAAISWTKSRLAFLVTMTAVALIIYSSSIDLPYSIFGRMAGTYRAERAGDHLSDKFDKSAQTRLTIWRGGMEMVRDNPIFGVGYGQFPSEIGKYAPEVSGMDPHNNVLKIAAEMGIPAALSFLLVIAMCLWKGYKLYSKIDDPLVKAMVLGYVGSVVGLFVANLFGSRLDSEEITTQFWAMTAVVMLAAANVPKAASDEPEQQDTQDAYEST